MEPLVSIIIPVHNRENTLKRAIDSVLNQTYHNMELIIVDDGSTDTSVRIAKEYSDARVRIITLSHNVGAAAARNAGLREARGEYIAFQDSDDEWLPDKLKTQIDYMQKEGFSVSFCPYILVLDDNYEETWPAIDKIQRIKEKGIRSVLHQENVVGTPTIVMKREVMEQIGLFDELFPSIEDYDYVIRISQKYDMGFWDIPLMKAYRQKISITTNTDAYLRGAELLIGKHSDFLDVESRIKGTVLFNTLQEESFTEGVERIQQLYAKGDKEKERYINDVILKTLGQKYIMMKRVEKYGREFRILHLREKAFAIYGAGIIGKKIYFELKQSKLVPQMFIVSEYQKNTEQVIDGIPVKKLDEVEDKDIEIIIAVGLETQEAILKNLRKRGFNNYFILDELTEGAQIQ